MAIRTTTNVFELSGILNKAKKNAGGQIGRQHFLITGKCNQPDQAKVVERCEKAVFNDCATNCLIKGRKSDWDDLPPSKSLFHSPPGSGLPICNLTSQVFANFYMDAFDQSPFVGGGGCVLAALDFGPGPG